MPVSGKYVVWRIVERAREMKVGIKPEDFKWFDSAGWCFIRYERRPGNADEVEAILNVLKSTFSTPELFVRLVNGFYLSKWAVLISINNLSRNEVRRLVRDLRQSADCVEEALARGGDGVEVAYGYYDMVSTIKMNGREYKYIKYTLYSSFGFIEYGESLKSPKWWARARAGLKCRGSVV